VQLPNSASSNNELDDPIITQSVLSLVNLSEQRLSMVSSGLATLLENISKVRPTCESCSKYESPPQPSTSSSSETNPVLERSQLFVLQSLGKCMDRHWEFFVWPLLTCNKALRPSFVSAKGRRLAQANARRNIVAGYDGTSKNCTVFAFLLATGN